MNRYDIKTIYDWPLPARVIVLIVVFILVYFLAYKWDITSLNDQLISLQDQEGDLKSQFQLVAKKKANLTSDIAQFPALRETLNIWRKELVNQEQLPELLNEILKIGSNNHLYFTIFDPGEPIKDSFYYKIPIKITVVGSYHQVATFLSQLANMTWLIEIGDFLISDENKNDVLGAKLAEFASANNLLTASLNLNIYYLPGKGVVNGV